MKRNFSYSAVESPCAFVTAETQVFLRASEFPGGGLPGRPCFPPAESGVPTETAE